MPKAVAGEDLISVLNRERTISKDHERAGAASRPFVVFGGSAPKRAARLATPTCRGPHQALADAYVANAGGWEGRRHPAVAGRAMWVFVTDDPTVLPDRPHPCTRPTAYGAWSVHAPGQPWREVTSVDEVRRAGLYAVVSRTVRCSGPFPRQPGRAHPQALVGGLDPASGGRRWSFSWTRCSRLLASRRCRSHAVVENGAATSSSR